MGRLFGRGRGSLAVLAPVRNSFCIPGCFFYRELVFYGFYLQRFLYEVWGDFFGAVIRFVMGLCHCFETGATILYFLLWVVAYG